MAQPDIQEPARTLRIGFAWQSLSSGNLGLGALARSHLEIARRAAASLELELECVELGLGALGGSPPGDIQCEIADPLSLRRMLTGRSRYLSQMSACDAILDIGSGDSFSEIYGMRRFLVLSLSKLLAVILGKPLVLSPQTIGPFIGRASRALSQFLIRRADRVFARDELSLAYLKRHGLDDNADVATDVAFRLPFERRSFEPSGVVRVGINVSGLLYDQGPRFDLVVEYRALVQRLIERFLAMPGIEVHLIAHVFSQAADDDHAIVRRLHARHPGTVLAPRFSGPSEAKGYIGGLDFFTGSRMHACIGAFSTGVPVVPMAYSRKFTGLFHSLGYPHVADLRKDDLELTTDKVISGFEHRAALREAISEGNLAAEAKLKRYEEYLVSFFKRLADRRRELRRS
jgi:polysaccharide pyruvyl transferase WcaK-like protein